MLSDSSFFRVDAATPTRAGLNSSLLVRRLLPAAAFVSPSTSVIHELNIGHVIVAQALFVGWKEAVAEMKRLMVVAAG